MQIVLATKNEDKKKEILKICKGLNIEFLTLKDYPDMPDVIEDGQTFKDNAIKKAREVSLYTGKVAMADDSGLMVDILDGAPGIYSARFSGENATYESNNKKLLSLLSKYLEKEKRRAKFVCAIAFAKGDNIIGACEDICEGYIANEPRGQNGFGYDPLFIFPKYGKTFAEIQGEEKNKISHRAKALVKARDLIKQMEVCYGE